MLREDLIKRKLSFIQDDLVNLDSLGQNSLSDIAKDPVKQAALERFLERVINRAFDINQHIIKELAGKNVSAPKDYYETFLGLATLGVYPKEFGQEIAKSVGTRNVLVHEYDKTDNERVYNSVSDCMRDYKKYIDYVLAFLEKQSQQ